MRFAESPADRESQLALRFGCVALLVLAIIAGVGLRFRHLGAHFDHFDEVFPVALITRARATGNFDMNVRDADVPAIAKYNQYAGSSYHYSVLAWDAVMRVFRGWPEDNRNRPSLLRLRAFSATLGSIALVLVALIAWRTAGPLGSLFATTLTAFNPTLVQDAHYARPDAFILVLTLLYFLLVGQNAPPRWRRAMVAGLVLGVLVAAKNTMGLVAALPCLWFVQAGTRRRALQMSAVCGVAALLAFAATEPGVWRHFSDFMDGVRRLQVQYSHPFPISGPPDGGTSFAMMAAYFLATLGAISLVLAGAGAVLAIRRGAWLTLALWAAPALVFGLYFGSKTIFFERAYSPFLPGLFVLGGIAVAGLANRVRSRLAVVMTVTACAVAPGALVSMRFVGDTLSGDYGRRVTKYDQALGEAFPRVPMVITPMWYAGHLDPLIERWRGEHQSFIVRVADYDDAWTQREYTELLTQLPAHEFASLDGPFAGFPVSTLQVYHTPTWRYVWVGALPAAGFPVPPPANLDTALKILATWLNPPWRYEALAWIAALLTLWLAFRSFVQESRARLGPKTVSSAGRVWLFPASVVLTLFAFRWPAFFHHPELNVDEAHTIAGAITLSFDPVYWRSVDGTTHGPLNDFVLLWPRLFGWPINFLTARVLGCGLMAGALLWVWAGVRALWGEAMGRMAVLPLLAFFAFSTFWDFIHYSSEHLSIFLLATAWGLLVLASRRSAPVRWCDTWRWASAGLALGAVPWAKMQGGPIAAVLAAYGIWAAWPRGSHRSTGDWRAVAALITALALPSVLVAIHLSVFHLWPDFWQSYVVNNLRYATQTKMFTVSQMTAKLPWWLGQTEGLQPLVLGMGAFSVAALSWIWRFDAAAWRRLALAVVLAVVAWYTAVAPGRVFHHYLLFAVIPFVGVGIALLAGAPRSSWISWTAVALFIGATVGPQIVAKAQRPNPFFGDVAAYPDRISRVAQAVRAYARPGECLGIWGFMPRFYVETGLPQASREGHNERQLLPHPQLGYYRARYLGDLRAHRPAVFLDAVGPAPAVFWPNDRAQFGHETWPELRAWLDANYAEVADVDSVRVYVRTDRLPPKA